MNTIESLCAEADKYFKQLEKDKKATQKAHKYITDTINNALAGQDISLLLSLIPYIEEGEGHLAYQYIGEIHRTLQILHIIQLECRYHKEIFCVDCRDNNALTEKYMLSLFAFRRLLFQLSDDSFNEAVYYLQNRPISVFAVYVITQNELIIPNDALYENLLAVYSGIWSDADAQLFLSMVRAELQFPVSYPH